MQISRMLTDSLAVVKYHVKTPRLEIIRARFDVSMRAEIAPARERTGRDMDRLFANGTVNAGDTGEGTPLILLHSLLSDRASFDAIVPELAKSFRVIVPDLPGFGESRAVGGGLAD